MEADPILRPLYPHDLAQPRRHLAGFLAQRWGGPPTYTEDRGHPRLRLRHAPFDIGPAQRDAWYRHMSQALANSELSDADRDELQGYFAITATQLINRA